MSDTLTSANDTPVCVLTAANEVAIELNEHLRWLNERIEAVETTLGLTCRPNPTAKPKIITTRSAGWGNGTK